MVCTRRYAFTIDLCRADLDALKEVRALATAEGNTHMSLTTEVAKDVQGRPVLPTEPIAAKQVST